MPLQKSSSQKSGKSRMKSTAKTSPARLKSRSRTAPPVLPARPLTNQVRPGMSPRRVKQRTVRREGARQAVNHVQPQRPRPNVRPTGRPVKVMPRTPAPAIPRVKARPKVRVPKPAPRASSGSKSPGVVAAAVGAGAAAAGFLALNASRAPEELTAEVNSLQSSLSDLQSKSTFDDISNDIKELDALLKDVLDLLESARDKGYRYAAEMETTAYNLMSQWEGARPQVMEEVKRQAQSFQRQVRTLDAQVQRLNANLYSETAAEPHLRETQSQVNNLLSEVTRVESELEDNYDEVEDQARKLDAQLVKIHWAMDQLLQAEINLEHGEDLVMAVPARWDKEGKDDPEGVLYLTNQRLLFEQKEKVATKKILFVTTASELVQEVLIDQPLNKIGDSKAENKGLFGHQDYLTVEFSDQELGEISFHLDGQDSNDWAVILKRAQSGEIESGRISGSAGLSIGDLTRQLTSADIMALQAEVNALQDELMLKDARDELAELENLLRSLERKLARVRARGYTVEKGLENDIKILDVQWQRVYDNAVATIDFQTKQLANQMESIQEQLAALVGKSTNLTAARPLYIQVKSAVASAEAQAEAAEDTVYAQYDEYADEVESLEAHLEWVEWMLAAQEQASFRLLATESGVAAIEAVYQHPGREPENGILFLTDQRILWEDRVDRYELMVDVPLSEVVEVQEEEEGEQETLNIQFGAQAPVPSGKFQLVIPDADNWIKMIGRARSGGYAQDRVETISDEELERIRNAPQQCSNCGAVYTAPILRGQNEIVCEYCGVVTRI